MAGKLIAIVCVAILCGCVSVTGTVYVPASSPDTVSGKSCAGPYAFFSRKLADGVTLTVQINWASSGQAPALGVEGGLEYGKSIRFLDKRVIVSSPSGSSVVEIEGWKFRRFGPAESRPPSETFGPTEKLLGASRNASVASAKDAPYLLNDHFVSMPVKVPISGIASRTESIVVSLPRIIANGTPVEIPSITFAPEQYSHLVGLCG